MSKYRNYDDEYVEDIMKDRYEFLCKNRELESKLLQYAHRISDQNEEILELKQQLTEERKKLCDEIKKHFDNNFYFDISGAMCVSMNELDEFLDHIKRGENDDD